MKGNWKIKGLQKQPIYVQKKAYRKIISGICVFVWECRQIACTFIYYLLPTTAVLPMNREMRSMSDKRASKSAYKLLYAAPG